MVVNKVLVCPICGKKTFLRIQNGGYLNEYPVRVNCFNCKALLKGDFIMNSHFPLKGLFMINADVEECDMDQESLSCKNADYVAEVSGELPCNYVSVYNGGLPISPFINTAKYIDSMEDYINRLKYFTNNIEEWKRKKSMAFQLLDDGSIDYISTALNNKMGEYTYECDHYLKAIHCIQEVVLEETKHLFIQYKQDDYIKNIISEMALVDQALLHQFVSHVGGIQELVVAYRKTIAIFSEFMNIYANVLPAETYMHFKEFNISNKCISTCSFTDIKSFYQDAYEALLSLSYIPVCLDNIVIRGDYNLFDSSYNDVFCPNNKSRNLDWYKKIDNGTRVNKLNNNEKFQGLIDFPANRLLRNGIGHNNIKYDSITQVITAFDMKKPERIVFQDSLMSVAIDCLKLTRSVVIYSEMILFLLRLEFKKDGIRSIIHPRFYKGVQPNDKCPCGSNIKYKKCCKSDVDNVKRT